MSPTLRSLPLVAQVMVIPISEGSVGYAQKVRATLRAAKLHVEVDASDKKMQKKVREAQLAQYNYILVRRLLELDLSAPCKDTCMEPGRLQRLTTLRQPPVPGAVQGSEHCLAYARVMVISLSAVLVGNGHMSTSESCRRILPLECAYCAEACAASYICDSEFWTAKLDAQPA